ncbi:MAG: hypothetical protein EWV90_09925 [Microcystis aeruginosa Ma_QC_Ch_20071001_M135]|nr:MAG: hypothetical protein EWV90_09925 [Microcystis aeruginosa Ma_QC_Ch_20071001_M135]
MTALRYISPAMASIAVILTLGGCSTSPTAKTTFTSVVEKCVSSNLSGPTGQVVFLGPNDYRPGDIFTRSMNANKEWVYSGQYEYSKLVPKEKHEEVVRRTDAGMVCNLNSDSSFSLDTAAEGAFKSAAIPISAKAGMKFQNGTISAIRAKNITLESIPYLEEYPKSLEILPEMHRARLAVKRGGYFIASAVLMVEEYTIEVKYGPTFDAIAEANASISGDDSKSLKASIGIKAKDAHTLVYTIPQKTAIAIVARGLNPDFSIQSVGGSSASKEKIEATAAHLENRSKYTQ